MLGIPHQRILRSTSVRPGRRDPRFRRRHRHLLGAPAGRRAPRGRDGQPPPAPPAASRRSPRRWARCSCSPSRADLAGRQAHPPRLDDPPGAAHRAGVADVNSPGRQGAQLRGDARSGRPGRPRPQPRTNSPPPSKPTTATTAPGACREGEEVCWCAPKAPSATSTTCAPSCYAAKAAAWCGWATWLPPCASAPSPATARSPRERRGRGGGRPGPRPAGANAGKVIESVKARLAEIAPQLPPGVSEGPLRSQRTGRPRGAYRLQGADRSHRAGAGPAAGLPGNLRGAGGGLMPPGGAGHLHRHARGGPVGQPDEPGRPRHRHRHAGRCGGGGGRERRNPALTKAAPRLPRCPSGSAATRGRRAGGPGHPHHRHRVPAAAHPRRAGRQDVQPGGG